ncbi:Inherit from COG: Hemolysin-type calcium-binding [Seminavis robusta]|uniref:Inherit from COG: Hemolysin-type calcium-binding n=1 Tax=Seminavis robusta TaxID=568900 RepID=A0A9N8H3K5_9STRA|nr:Inherit from COG: Hemolysin-type calcium-binding [Seminavis robusta]|eukprot:Sro28_g018780.1 Inherit from COG: Hemolysin-type calcium-binding (656) ;mRNA; r:113986-116110
MKTTLLSTLLALLLGVGSGNAGTIRSASVQSESNANVARHLQAVLARNDTYEMIQGTTRLDVNLVQQGLLANDTSQSAIPLVVTDVEEWGIFQGNLRVEDDGTFRYDPPSAGFTGTEIFSYTACLGTAISRQQPPVQAAVCSTANVTIKVLEDPNRPNEPPTAEDDSYTVKEDEDFEENAPGFLGNDRRDSGLAIFRDGRPRTDGRLEGDLDTEEDGSFEYKARRCWTGDEVFFYTVCYVDYPDLCDEGRVTIRVEEDNNKRPNPPNAQNDRYEVKEGESLDKSEGDGILSNDGADKGQEIEVEDHDETSGFKGDLHVSSDGSFTYRPEPGELGSFWFEYEVCYEEWSCVACRTARVEIVVQSNPEKPDSPPTPVNDQYTVVQGGSLDVSEFNGVLTNDVKDSRYSLFVDSYDFVGDGQGDLDVDDDGSFEYEPDGDFLGTESFTYEVCYREWPDLCAQGTATFTVTAPAPPDTGVDSRRGRATSYQVRWDAADDEAEDCDTVSPRLTLQCGLDGELEMVDISPSDNDACVLNSVTGVLQCSPSNEGIIYVACRDGRADNSTRRQLLVSMSSDAVACEVDDSEEFHLSWTYHAMSLQAYCNDQWTERGMDCSGKVLTEASGSTLCYQDAVTSGTSSQPADVMMNSTSYEDCGTVV